MNFDPASIRKILVLRLRSIGDILLSNPSLAALKRTFPRAVIHFVVDDVFEDLLYNNKNVDMVITNPRDKSSRGLMTDIAFIRRLRQENYDLAVDLQAGPRGAFAALLSGARHRIGHHFQFRNWLCYNMKAETPYPDDHSWRVQFKVVTPLGAQWPEEPEYFLDFPESATQSITNKLEKEGLMFDRPLVLLHPGARTPVKRWPAESMGALARWLVDEMEMAVILAGSASDDEEIKTIRRASGYALPAYTDLTLWQLAALIKMSAMIVCNDSGPMHMAGVLDTPVVAIFGPSDPVLWGPVGQRKSVVTCEPMECQPCDQNNCIYEGDHCTSRIELPEVQRAVERLWELTRPAD
ncbi:MAG: lipopolysaccharide heptosyltransferase II [Nitrospinota bacterium]|nr:lipopolysaccharide heptosyltransferase II [Nitrospinota bacterium]